MMFVRGFCRGIKTVPNFDKDKAPKVVAGIGVPKVNGFENEETIHEVVLSPDQIKGLYPEKFNRLRDQMVEVPFEPRSGIMNNRAWQSFACRGEPYAFKSANRLPNDPPLSAVESAKAAAGK